MSDLFNQAIRDAPNKITRLTSKNAAILALRPFVGQTALPPREDVYAILIALESRTDIFDRLKKAAMTANPDLGGFY